MNKYLKAAMDEVDGKLPKTMEDYSRMHPAEASRVPMAHIQRLKEESLAKKTEAVSRLTKIDFK